MAEQKNNESQNNTEEQQILKELENQAMTKLTEAIQLNKSNNRAKESREAKAEACALILIAIRAGVQFDPQDPIFQIFVQKQSWRDAMKRACKEVCDPTTALAQNTLKVLHLVSDKAGHFVENLLNLFEKHGVKPLEQAEVYNQDLWNDFYDEIPKDGGNAQSNRRTNIDLHKFLSRNGSENKEQKKITNRDFQKFLLDGMSNNSSDQKTMGNQRVISWIKEQKTTDVA